MIPAKLLLLLGTAALASCSVGGHVRNDAQRSYVNPVLNGDFPDPAVLDAVDGWFYAYATQTLSAERTVNIQVARSRDLVHWEHLGDALPGKPRWAATKQNLWAPHVIHDRQQRTYFMYYAAEPDGASGRCLAVATAGSPQGPFADSGSPLLCGEGVEHIDPMAFDDPITGKRLLYWGSGSRPIKVQELAHDRLRFLPASAPSEILFPDNQSEYTSLIEGAWVIYRNGSYFLFYSGDRCCGSHPNYAVMIARANNAFGPFELFGAPGRSSVILRENSVWRAPGHGSVVSDAEGTDWFLYHAIDVLHAKERAQGQPARRVMLLDRITYQDGWPRIAGNEPSVNRRDAPAVRLPD